MTREEKKLLLIDLCVRSPYGVRIAKGNLIYPVTGVNIALGYVELAVSERISIEEVKPYLRPMSSMTDEEKKAYKSLQDKIAVQWDNFNKPIGYTYAQNVTSIDWLNKKMFDYRGLIKLGLALEAPEGMYDNIC